MTDKSSKRQRVGFGATFFSPLTDEQFANLGRVTATLSQVEFHLDLMIMFTLGMNNAFMIGHVLEGRAFSAKVDLLKTLATAALPDAQAKVVRTACSALKEVTAKRNLAIHGRWATELDAQGVNEETVGSAGRRVVAHQYGRRKARLPADRLGDLLAEVERAAALTFEAASLMIPSYSPEELPLREFLVREP